MNNEFPPPRGDLPEDDHPSEGLSPRQRELAGELRRLDPQLAGLYEHAVRLLPRLEEPGMAYLVAHAGRELSRGVVRRLLAEEGMALPVDAEDLAKDEKNRGTIAQVLQLPPQDPRVSLWFHLHRQFSDAVHYRDPGPSAAELRIAYDELGGLLFGRIGPYFATQAELDVLLAIEHPTPDNIERLQRNLLRPAQRRYFFSRLDHPGWAKPLADVKVFGNPPERVVDPETGAWSTRAWPEGEYLVRVAGSVPETVVQVLREVPEDLENPAVWNLVAEAACVVPPDFACRLVTLLTKALEHAPAIIYPEAVARLVAHLAADGRKEAFKLAEYLLFVPDSPPEVDEGDSGFVLTMRTQWMLPRLEWNALEAFLNSGLPALESLDSEKTLRMLLAKVNRIQRLAEMLGVGGSWGLWHDAFEDSSDREKIPGQLASATAEVAERFASSEPEAAKTTLSTLDKYNGRIFQRIRYRVLGAAGKHLQEELDSVIASQEAIEPELPAREIAALLRSQYSNASPGARRLFRYALLRGPDVDTLRYYIDTDRDAEPTEDDLEEARKRWQRKRLIWFRGDIPDELRDIAEGLDIYGLRPSHEDQELAEVGTYIGGVSWGGEPTPATAEQLSNQSPRAVFEFLRDWKAGVNGSSGTLRGLELAVGDYAATKPDEALAVGEFAIQHALRPEFLETIIRGVGRAAESGEFKNWAGLLRFLSEAIREACDTDRQLSSPDAATWREVVDAIVGILDEGCANDRIPLDLEEEVWSVVIEVVQCPIPGNEFNREPLASIDGVLMASLNDSAGKVARVVISAALWMYRARVREEPADERRAAQGKEAVRPRLVPLLEDIMHLGGRAGIAAHAMVGQFIPQLHLLVPEWITQIAERLFAGGAEDPINKPAWGAYIVRSRVYDSVFQVLRLWYKKAADVAGRDADWKATDTERWSLDQSLATHVLVSFLRGNASLGDSDRLVETTFANVLAKERGRAYWGIFRGLSDAEEAPSPEFLNRLVSFWEWRLAELERVDPGEAAEEAKGLAWFFRTPHIPDEAVLRLGLRTAEFAGGDVDLHTDWERLRELARVDVDTTFQIAELVLLAQLRARYSYVPVEDVKPLLRQALHSGHPETRNSVRALIHRLGEHGFADFGDLLAEGGPS